MTNSSSGPSLSGSGRAARQRAVELLTNLTLREIRGQFKRTTFGRLWSVINPVVTIAIYAVVFSTIMRVEIQPGTNSGVHLFVFFLASALLPWSFISNGLQSGMASLTANSGLLSKVWFPRWIPVLSSVLANTSTFLIELGVLAVIMVFVGGPQILLLLPLALVLVAITAVFVSGLALMLSITNVYFRDTQHFIGLGVQLWFYLTPIIYPINLVYELELKLATEENIHIPLKAIWELNPAYHFTNAFRDIFYNFSVPSWDEWLWMIGWAAAVVALGSWLFNRRSARIVEEL